MVHAGERLLQLVNSRMAERGLSLREAARRAGVSHSSVSRLLSGRARPTAGLLCALAPALGVPAEELLGAAGLAAEGAGDVLGALRGMGLDPAPPELVGRVSEELKRLRSSAGTEQARALVREGLHGKLAALGARGPVADRLRALGALYLGDGPAPAAARLAAGCAVLYFLQAVDAIDDFMWPIGYLDDAVAITLAEAEVTRILGEGWSGLPAGRAAAVGRGPSPGNAAAQGRRPPSADAEAHGREPSPGGRAAASRRPSTGDVAAEGPGPTSVDAEAERRRPSSADAGAQDRRPSSADAEAHGREPSPCSPAPVSRGPSPAAAQAEGREAPSGETHGARSEAPSPSRPRGAKSSST